MSIEMSWWNRIIQCIDTNDYNDTDNNGLLSVMKLLRWMCVVCRCWMLDVVQVPSDGADGRWNIY